MLAGGENYTAGQLVFAPSSGGVSADVSSADDLDSSAAVSFAEDVDGGVIPESVTLPPGGLGGGYITAPIMTVVNGSEILDTCDHVPSYNATPQLLRYECGLGLVVELSIGVEAGLCFKALVADGAEVNTPSTFLLLYYSRA